METLSSKRTAVSAVRLVVLFGATVGSIISLAIIAVVSFAEWPLVTATLWHLRNGNTVHLEGHSFHVPLLYEPEISKGGRQIDILESPRLFSGGASVTVESNSKVFDEGSANRWRANLLGALGNNRSDTSRSLPLTLRGKKLTFVCVEVTVGAESLICHVAGTDLTVSTWARPTQIKEIHSMLETSE